jgi:hypothetical protein
MVGEHYPGSPTWEVEIGSEDMRETLKHREDKLEVEG